MTREQLPESTSLEGALPDMTLRVGCEDFFPKPPSFEKPVQLQWCGRYFELNDAEVWEENGSLVLQVYGVRPLGTMSTSAALHALNETGIVQLGDQSEIMSPLTHATQAGAIWRSDGTRNPGIRFELPAWIWNEQWVRTLPLVCRISGLKRFGTGNLLIGSPRKTSTGHFRGQGALLWHVLKEGRAIAEARPGLDDLLLGVRGDIDTLEFVFGTGLDVAPLWATDGNGAVVGGLGPGRLPSICHRWRCPTPVRPHQPACWSAPLFRLVAGQVHSNNKDILTAITGYLDGLRGHIHGSYLQGQVALEAICRKYVPKEARCPLVASPDAWRQWVSTVEEDIVQLAADKDAAKVLMNKMRDNVFQRPTGNVVEKAFDQWLTPLPEELLAEVGLRSKVAHGFTMFDEDTGDFQGASDRVDKIMFMLAATVSNLVGYRGPLVGWKRDETGLKEPEFWKSQHVAEAIEDFTCGERHW